MALDGFSAYRTVLGRRYTATEEVLGKTLFAEEMAATGDNCADCRLHADYAVEVLPRVLTGQQSNGLPTSLATTEESAQHINLIYKNPALAREHAFG